jgi:hypothetical protein
LSREKIPAYFLLTASPANRLVAEPLDIYCPCKKYHHFFPAILVSKGQKAYNKYPIEIIKEKG